MRRREFITLFGSAAAWPLTAYAQQSIVPVIGYMDTASAGTTAHLVEAFRRGLSAAGYDEGLKAASSPASGPMSARFPKLAKAR